MNLLEMCEAEWLSFRLEVEQLAANHPAGARRAHQLRDDHTTRVERQPKLASRGESRRRGERHHGYACGGRDAHAEHAMHCWASASHFVVVHARQVVVHE